MSFAGRRVLALESRRALEMAELIRKRGGLPFVAPSMREAPLEANDEALRFADKLFAGGFDMMILLTGVGLRLLARFLEKHHPPERFISALRKLTVVARGPKPAAVLRDMQVPISIQVPEPNTWRELLAATEGSSERSIALQEYGRPNPELIGGLAARGATVTSVRVYDWDLPEDPSALREAVRRMASGDFDVAMFTTSIQIAHFIRVAAEAGIEQQVRRNLARIVIASIGPTTSEALEEYGIRADFMPSHPKMGFLVQETADKIEALIGAKS
jgi:uroporphyrinogen-III synthase